MIETAAETDGRRRRSLDSRARIVAAMVELVQEGQVAAGAEVVAERAQVGLRSVFRHFNDMDSLYREMLRFIEERVLSDLDRTPVTGPWPLRLEEVIRRRAALYERITPFKRAEAAQRHKSSFLEEDVRNLNARLREHLAEVLADSFPTSGLSFEALDLLLSFEAWDRLRREQSLSVEAAQAVLQAAVAGLVK